MKLYFDELVLNLTSTMLCALKSFFNAILLFY
ncbi:hypothetical protein SAMN05444003_2107 [Cognatiyoonia sediminum]|uniref:Uncharacterized protein n=1 Tax=Cognatiyoonia sediminum TaxID=1508389 RepID=A0A1M5Q8X0_9RHOB|nr:hypothetical protein SAMN05444003_2107 [Cognatiyoonia sediminum]